VVTALQKTCDCGMQDFDLAGMHGLFSFWRQLDTPYFET
jgi:hypothetical protein